MHSETPKYSPQTKNPACQQRLTDGQLFRVVTVDNLSIEIERVLAKSSLLSIRLRQLSTYGRNALNR